jgi:hypothetical protein
MLRLTEPIAVIDLDREACYRAVRARDARFDGRFYTCVVTTGIYCRPVCPARPPKQENCLFMPSAAAAHAAGFSALAAAVLADGDLLRPYGDLDATVAQLAALPGIGPWTAQYIAMRALREPDAFPATDVGLLRAMATNGSRPTPAQLLASAEAWRPWRAYAAMHLWMSGAHGRRADAA